MKPFSEQLAIAERIQNLGICAASLPTKQINMRLINTRTIRLTQFSPDVKTDYAILSHTWGMEEISFQEIQSENLDVSKQGYKKIKETCRNALSNGYDFVWIDTCCKSTVALFHQILTNCAKGIDKSSSAELSESINSMFKWYKDAAVCYVYLDDVSTSVDDAQSRDALYLSRWFTRGWTLQELLAPKEVLFYSKDWECLGTKYSLRPHLARITNIHTSALSNTDMRDFSVAQRFSWASQRVTTRPEDRAYCLMGIVGVHMPLLYGEGGERAFVRLQEEIFKSSDDHSMFAWSPHRSVQDGFLSLSIDKQLEGDDALRELASNAQSLFAKSPANFERSRNIVPFKRFPGSPASSITNKGVQLSVPILHCPKRWPTDTFIPCMALLDCHVVGAVWSQIGITLSRWEKLDCEQYSRIPSDPALVPIAHFPNAVEKTIYISEPPAAGMKRHKNTNNSFYFVTPRILRKENCELANAFPSYAWNDTGIYHVLYSRELIWKPQHVVLHYRSRGRYLPCSFLVILEYFVRESGVIVTDIITTKESGQSLESIHDSFHESSNITKPESLHMKTTANASLEDPRLDVKVTILCMQMLHKQMYMVDVEVTPGVL